MAVGQVEKKGENFTEAELKHFLSSCRIVVADNGTTSGHSIRKFLMQYGATSENTIVCETLEQAKIEVAAAPAQLLYCDLSLGLELIALQESPFPNRAGIATILLGADPSSDSMGTIVDANVDAMLIKPFNAGSFKDSLYQALANKIKPSPYWLAIEEGKKLLKEGRLDEAEKIFEGTKSLDPEPTLSFYSLAYIHDKNGNSEAAIGALKEGLALNAKDYRCMTSLFELFLRNGKYQDAYDLAQKIHRVYPVSTARIGDLVKLSVAVRKFADIVDYYGIFKDLDRKDTVLNRIVIAGLLVCAKYFYTKEEVSLSREVMQNAAKVALMNQLLMPEVLRYFAETAQPEAGLEYYKKLSEEVQNLPESQMVYVELVNQTGDYTGAVHWGAQLLQKGIVTPRLYEVVIGGSMRTGRNAKAVQDLIAEAKEKFPSAQAIFERAGSKPS